MQSLLELANTVLLRLPAQCQHTAAFISMQNLCDFNLIRLPRGERHLLVLCNVFCHSDIILWSLCLSSICQCDDVGKYRRTSAVPK